MVGDLRLPAGHRMANSVALRVKDLGLALLGDGTLHFRGSVRRAPRIAT